MSTPAGNAYSAPAQSDEVQVPVLTSAAKQRLRALLWPSIWSATEGALEQMEAEIVHLGDPNTVYAIAQVRNDGRLLTHPVEESDLQAELYMKARDRNYTDFAGTVFSDDPGF